MSLRNIRVCENISDKYEEVSYDDVYRNFFTTDDLSLFFLKYKERIVSFFDKGDDWNFLLCSSICGTIKENERYVCLGCTLLKRFNPVFSADKEGSIKTGKFMVKSGKLEGENFEIKKISVSRGEVIKNLCLLDIFLPSHNNILFFYICNNEFVYCTRQFDYGNGTFDVLINNNFTSIKISQNERYLSGEIIEAILHQVENYLKILDLYNFHPHNLSLKNLAFSSDIYNEGNESFSITIYLVLDDMVIEKNPSYSIDEEMEFFVSNLKNDEIFLRSLNFHQRCN